MKANRQLEEIARQPRENKDSERQTGKEAKRLMLLPFERRGPESKNPGKGMEGKDLGGRSGFGVREGV